MEEHFISAGWIINHCHYLSLSPGVSTACPHPQLDSLNSFSVWRQWRPACIWVPDAFSGFSSACVWKGDYNLRLSASLPHWRAKTFWPWNWMWQHQTEESLLFTCQHIHLPWMWLSDRMKFTDLSGPPHSQLCSLIGQFLSFILFNKIVSRSFCLLTTLFLCVSDVI